MPIKYLALFLLTQFSAFLVSIGPLIHTSFLSSQFSQPARVAIIQAVGTLCSLIVSFFFRDRIRLKSLVGVCLLGSTLNLLGSFISGELVLGFLFVRLFSVSLLANILISELPRLAGSDFRLGNKGLQGWASVATLSASIAIPVISKDLRVLYAVDLVIVCITIFLVGDIADKVDNSLRMTANGRANWRHDFASRVFGFTAVVTVLLWIFGGIFSVVEVPLLIQRYSSGATLISTVFFLTLSFNTITVLFLNHIWVEKHSSKLMLVGLSALGAASMFYLNFANLWIAIFSVVGIGVGNGVFNLAQTSVLQKIEQPQSRLSAFIVIRGLSQMGVVIGALVAQALPANVSFSVASVSEKNHPLVKVLLQSVPSDLIPYKALDSGSLLVSSQVFHGLFEYDSKNNLTPVLARSLRWSANNEGLEIKLSQDARFSNGDPVASDDVINTLLEARKYLGKNGDWAFGRLKEIRRVDDRTLNFIFRQKFSLMPAILASPYFRVFKRLQNGEVIGTGKFAVRENTNGRIFLERVKYFDGAGPREVEFSSDFQAKEVYDILDLPPDFKDKRYRLFDYKTLQTILLVLNNHDPQFDTPLKRCSFLRFFQSASLRTYHAWGPVELGLPFSWNLFTSLGNPPEGEFDFKGPVEILYANSSAKFEEVYNEEIAKSFEKKGIGIRFTKVPIGELARRGATGAHQALLFGFIPDFVHPDALLSPLIKTNQQYNFSGYSNAKVDKLLDAATAREEKVEQIQLYREAVGLVGEDCPLSFVGSQNGTLWIARELESPTIGQLGLHTLDLSTLKWRLE